MKKSVFLLLLCLLLLPQGSYAADAPAPYGANLFQGNFGQGGAAGTIAPGDRVVLRLWGGSLNVDTILEVSPAGQLDIPEVGQLNVTGLAQDKLQDALRSKLAASGHADSQIYLAPMDAQPITLFVTGNVPKPGRYSGSAADPLLSYLDKAGGIDAGRGSYRNIQVRRNNQVVTTVDLYPFIREGSMPPIRFQNGDIIVVPDKGPTVTVTGKVRTSARFELPEGKTSGAMITCAENFETKKGRLGPQKWPAGLEKMKVIAITAQILMSRHITLVFRSLAPHPCMDTIGC